MPRMAKSKDRVPVGQESSPLTQSLSESLAALGGLRDRLPASPAPPSGPVPPAGGTVAGPAMPAAKRQPDGPVSRAKKLVVRRERKGHGGKTATRIEGLQGHPKDIEALAGEVKRAFGCGASVDGSDIVVQGDQAERLSAWLEARGAAKVVVGN